MSITDERSRQMTVGIWGPRADHKETSECWGTGVLVAPGEVLTCAHVIADEVDGSYRPREGTWTLRVDGDEARVTASHRSVRFHPSLDLAIISASTPGHPGELLATELSYADKLRTYGFPTFDQRGHFADGVIAGTLADGRLQLRLAWTADGQTDISGFSGAPLLRAGKIVGVMSAARTRSSTGAVVAQTAYAISIEQAHELDPSFFHDVPALAPLSRLLLMQEGMRRRHVFGNIPCQDTPRADGFPWIPLEEIYVEPDVSWHETSTPAIHSVLKTLTGRARVVMVDQGFGAGKSLTARTIAWRQSETYLEQGDKTFFPVFLPCRHNPTVKDLHTLLERSVAEEWASKLELAGASIFHELLSQQQQVLWIIDGVDELGVTDQSTRQLLDDAMNWRVQRPKDRFLFLCRSHTADAMCEHESADDWSDYKELRRFSLCHFSTTQRSAWLDKWTSNILTDQAPLTAEEHAALMHDETYNVPLLLLMGVTAAIEQRASQAPALLGSRLMLYEFFCTWVATGRWQTMQRKLTSLVNKTNALQHVDLPDGLGLAPGMGPAPSKRTQREGVASLLFLLSRLAWESIVIEQTSSEDDHADPDVLDRRTLQRVCDELGVDPSDVSALDSILLSAQGSNPSGARTFLFGHKSFREFLATRFHVAIFMHMATQHISSTDATARGWVEVLGRGDLLEYSEATRQFVRSVTELPQLADTHKTLAVWCARELADPTFIAPANGDACTHANDRRLSIRFAAELLLDALGDRQHSESEREARAQLALLRGLRPSR